MCSSDLVSGSIGAGGRINSAGSKQVGTSARVSGGGGIIAAGLTIRFGAARITGGGASFAIATRSMSTLSDIATLAGLWLRTVAMDGRAGTAAVLNGQLVKSVALDGRRVII